MNELCPQVLANLEVLLVDHNMPWTISGGLLRRRGDCLRPDSHWPSNGQEGSS